MIDPKLNEIPIPRSDVEAVPDRSRLRREGLSIKDTIAGDANLSVGAHGVDTSGVSSGAGAGAGSTLLTPTEDSSSLTGTALSEEEISARAYAFWCERGCPHGSPESDWNRAEEQLRSERRAGSRTMSASA